MLIDIGDPEEALRILDRLKVSEYGAKVPTDIKVYSWMKNFREQIQNAILETRNTPVESVWKPIRAFEEYEINQSGTVRNAKTGRELTKYDETPLGTATSLWNAKHACFVLVHLDPIVKELFDVDPNR